MHIAVFAVVMAAQAVVVTDATTSGGWIGWMPAKMTPATTADRPAQRVSFEPIVSMSFLLFALALIDPAHRDQRQPQVPHLAQHAVQRRLVGDPAAEHRRTVVAVAQGHPLEPRRPPPVQVSLQPDLVPGAFVHTLPLIAGHVGADCAGMILAEAPYEKDELTLLVDVGTNAEIVLGDRRRLLAASSPTGPAFEGAQISSGMRAAPGAIERVRIDPDTLEPRFRVIGCEPWSDEPGFGEAVASVGINGICGSGIVEVVAQLFLAGVITADGIIDGALASRTPRVVADGRTFSYVLHDGTPRLAITQNDVRAIQLAKAALYAGVRLLMDHLGVEAVDRVRLAGAFGSQIDVLHAMVLGLIPDCDLSQVSSAGNAAVRMVRLSGITVAAPRPWIARAATSRPAEGASAQAADATVNSSSPAT